jgi:23S rRNA (cytosine1962-C5)-methyltransferase
MAMAAGKDTAPGYELLDSGRGEKLERFGAYRLRRPCAQAIWAPSRPDAEWDAADAAFDRRDGQRWQGRQSLPEQWEIGIDGIRFRLSGTDFGHLGVFPEQRDQWRWIGERVRRFREVRQRPARVLNLFAYSGGSTLAAALAGAEVGHVDAAQGMVTWARENAALNGLAERPIRWLVDDVRKFLARELRREHRYDGIILDPPSFGRGSRGEVYKIDRDLPQTLGECRQLLSPEADFLLLSAHTPGLTPVALGNLLHRGMFGLVGAVETGEMLLAGAAGVLPVPNGAWARWAK